MHDLANAPLPVASFPSRAQIADRWIAEGDAVGLIAAAVRRFRPDVVMTLAAEGGFTRHPEHEAVARLTILGIHAAVAPLESENGHRVAHLYHVLNAYWFLGHHDQETPTDTIDADGSCGADREGEERSCLDVAMTASRAHRSQESDMRMIRLASGFWGTTYLRRLDPFGEEAEATVAELEPHGAPSP